MDEKIKEVVLKLTESAKTAPTGSEALHYSQAALNAAHAGQVLVQTTQESK